MEDIMIVKLPLHVTDKLQPLDVSCFVLLKREWERTLNAWVNERGPKNPMKKPNFVDMLVKIWHNCTSPDNIITGSHAQEFTLLAGTNIQKKDWTQDLSEDMING